MVLTSCTYKYILQVILRRVQRNTSCPLYYMPHVRVYKTAARVLKRVQGSVEQTQRERSIRRMLTDDTQFWVQRLQDKML